MQDIWEHCHVHYTCDNAASVCAAHATVYSCGCPPTWSKCATTRSRTSAGRSANGPMLYQAAAALQSSTLCCHCLFGRVHSLLGRIFGVAFLLLTGGMLTWQKRLIRGSTARTPGPPSSRPSIIFSTSTCSVTKNKLLFLFVADSAGMVVDRPN